MGDHPNYCVWLCVLSEQKVKVGHCPHAQISLGTGSLLLQQQADGSAHAAPDTATHKCMHTHTHKCVHKSSSTNFSGGHYSLIYRSNQVAPMFAHRPPKHVALQIANTCSHQTTCSYHLHVVIPFACRLACLANLSQCLCVNLTSWQAHWSASKMTWLARDSVLLFGSYRPQVPLKWATTAWFCKNRPKWSSSLCLHDWFWGKS